jgi:FKBP-type peptidyl-prolyl cis-trans isomerase FkpA
MTSSIKSPLAIVMAVSVLTLGTAACKPIDKDAKAGDAKSETPADKASTTKIEGLPTEKQQISYVIGMDIGKNIKPIKDEVDMDTINKAIQDVLADRKPLVNDEQMGQVMQAFATKMQAKQKAEMEAKAKTNLEVGTKFFAENGKKPGVTTTASGLQYQVVTMGKGAKPTPSDNVRVHYTGTLLDGTKFDSSYDRNEPAQFGVGAVVPGWTEALQLMPVGSKFKLWIPGKLGYGETGTPGGPIPPNAALVFDVELLEIVKQ